ncbi:DUF6602 domain-containing protein [Sulfuricurvum sp.]|uniref:DUF6602 domain-containing protein n=1 Tax=Sulfuricurvum sp. TaxID=2025608 RepID=UPI002735B2D5|nr:DUF6602 domain-containing protein [Sulfuricurvum sp.]
MQLLNIPEIFKSEAEDLKKVRKDAIRIHGTADIRAAGNEIEIHIREFFKRMLPKTLYITHGHLIDCNGLVSPQLDIIIADTSNLPSLMTTKDGTEYIPIDSVYACGEIKSTYYKNKKYIESFTGVLSKIKNEMFHEKIKNTAFNGIMTDETLLRDMYLSKGNRTLNNIFTFIFFVDSGDFQFKDIKAHFKSTNLINLPALSVLLNKGVILSAKIDEFGFNHTRYPDDTDEVNYNWCFTPFAPKDESATLEGNCLGFLYYSVLQHIANSYLEPPNLSKYLQSMQIVKKSTLEWLD